MCDVMFVGLKALTDMKHYTNEHLVEVLQEWGHFVKGHI